MGTFELVMASIAMLTLASGGVGIYVSAEKKILLARQENKFTQRQLDKLEERVSKFEDDIFKRLDQIQSNIGQINTNIAVLLDNKNNY